MLNHHNFAVYYKQHNMKNTGTAMNYMALRQAIQGKMMIVNLGGNNIPLNEENILENPVSRQIMGHEVYHISKNSFNLKDTFKGGRFPKKFGSFYHPFLLMGMPDMGGMVKLYVDTRFEGWYVLFASVKLDTWQNGPSETALDYVCWTPRKKGDTISKAGQRLIRSLIHEMDGLEEDETTTTVFAEENWEEEWNPSLNLLDAFKEVRG